MARKMRKFSEGGALGKYNRRMADIKKDFAKDSAGKSGRALEVLEAKRAQRTADAEDDRAKRTGADRTATRAAERAAESNLTKTRKFGAPKAVTTEAPAAKVTDSLGPITAPKSGIASSDSKPKPQSFGAAFRAARAKAVKEGRDPNKETFMFGGKKKVALMAGAPAATPTAAPKATATVTPKATATVTPKATATVTPKATAAPTATASKPKPAAARKPVDSIANRIAGTFSSKATAERSAAYKKRQEARGFGGSRPKPIPVAKPKAETPKLIPTAKPKDDKPSAALLSANLNRKPSNISPPRAAPTFDVTRTQKQRDRDKAEGRNAAFANVRLAKGGKAMKYAKGGSTPPQPTAAERKAGAKFRESLKKEKVTPENAAAIGRGNRSEKRFAAGGVTKEMPSSKAMGSMNMAKGGKAKMKPAAKAKGKPFAATKFGAAMMKKSADTKGRAMVKMASGGSVSKRADGCATKGKTKGKMLAMGGMAGYKRGGKTC